MGIACRSSAAGAIPERQKNSGKAGRDLTLEPVIGLEVHVQLKTDSKLFCRCSTQFGADPNSQICPICCGHPGTLPYLNKKAVELLVRAGLGVGCRIAPRSVFAR